MKITIKKIRAFLLVIILTAIPMLVLAGEANTQTTQIKFTNPLRPGTDNLFQFISLVLANVIVPIAGVIAVIFIMLAGFKFVTARGNEKEIGDAKRALLYAAIGTAILLGASAISAVIKATIDQVVR